MKNRKKEDVSLIKRNKKQSEPKDKYIFILFGLVFILISIIFENMTGNVWLNIFLKLLSHIGIGFFVIGVLGLLIDQDHWTQYFEKRLSRIVSEKEYLKNLDPSSLINIQTEVLKAYYKNSNIGGENGFLQFYQKNIQSFVSTPFRTNTHYNLQIDYEKSDSSKFIVSETTSWMCKCNGGMVQEFINWEPSEGEYEKVNSFELLLQHQSFSDKIIISHEEMIEKKYIFPSKMGFKFELKEYRTLEDLYITIKVNYIMKRERFIAWRMSLPSRGLCITVQFPKNLQIITEFFFNENNIVRTEKSSGSGYYYLNVEDWIMPDEGIAMQLLAENNVKNVGKGSFNTLSSEPPNERPAIKEDVQEDIKKA